MLKWWRKLAGSSEIRDAERRASESRRMLAFLHGFDEPDAFPQAEHRIREEFKLYRWPDGAEARVRHEWGLSLLADNPLLADVMMFHGDGCLREASLDVMDGPIGLPVVAYGLVSRLNDWASPVRRAAQRAFARRYPQTPAETLQPAVWTVLRHGGTWQRWEGGYADFIDMVMRRSDLAERLVERLSCERRGGASSVFRAMCRSARMDAYLERIAVDANQPQIRAMAIRYFSAGSVSWPSGTTIRVWIDKASGRYRDVPQAESRPLTTGYQLSDIVQKGLCDRSAIVRKQALDALIMHRRDERFRHLIAESLARFASETRPAIKERLDFLHRHSRSATKT